MAYFCSNFDSEDIEAIQNEPITKITPIPKKTEPTTSDEMFEEFHKLLFGSGDSETK